MKKIISVLLACVMIALCFAFVSCKKAVTIVGKWKGEIAADTISEMAGDTLDGMTLSGSIKFVFTFNENGKYSIDFDKDSVKKFWGDNLNSLIEFTASQAGIELTKESFLSLLGLENEDDFVDYMMDSMGDSFDSTTGTYSYSDGVLDMDGEQTRVELSAITLKIVEVIKPAEGEEAFDDSWLPLTLTKIG